MIELANHKPFGIGGRRLCFAHPLDQGKCIKVLRSDDKRTIRADSSSASFTSFRKSYDNNAHERQQLDRLYHRIGAAMREHLPTCYGIVATDLGPGMVLDLMRDHDGRISRSIRELVSTGTRLDCLKSAYSEFGEFMIKYGIQTRRILDHNLVAKHEHSGDYRLYLIDGFGDAAWIPVSSLFPPWGRKRIRRRIESSWHQMETFAAAGGISQETVLNSNWGQGFLLHRGDG